MFGLMRNFYRWCRHRKEVVVTVALLGVDNAGKSTVLSRMKGEFQEFIAPTIGFASEVIKQGSNTIKLYDLGGGANIRGIWPRYYAELHAAVFVIDSSDRDRLPVAREVLHQALDHPRFANKPLLIMANKQDKTEPMTSAEIASSLGLEKFKGLQYSVVTCTALIEEENSPPDPRIQQGLKWLTGAINSNYSALQKRIAEDSEAQKEEEKQEREEKRARVEARRRERELEREREEQGKGTELQTITTEAPPVDKVTIITETPTTPSDIHEKVTVLKPDRSATDLFNKGRDMFGNKEEEVHSARGSKQKTPRNSVYSSTTIMIKSEDTASEDHPNAIHDATGDENLGLPNNTHVLPKIDKFISGLPPLGKAKLEATPSPTLQTLHPLPPLEKPVYV